MFKRVIINKIDPFGVTCSNNRLPVSYQTITIFQIFFKILKSILRINFLLMFRYLPLQNTLSTFYQTTPKFLANILGSARWLDVFDATTFIRIASFLYTQYKFAYYFIKLRQALLSFPEKSSSCSS